MTLQEVLEALKIAFANLETAARADDKTPLQNALALNEAKELFASSHDSPTIAIFADINRFKAVNSEYGFAAGDAAIREVGIIIEENFVRKYNAQAFRIGGDEFLILLKNEYLDDFVNDVTVFEKCEVTFDGIPFSVGVSFGFAIANESIEFETIKSRAEIACKKAKLRGNGTCIEWSDKIDRDLLKNIRHTCSNCETIISCDLPTKLGTDRLMLCPVCEHKIV